MAAPHAELSSSPTRLGRLVRPLPPGALDVVGDVHGHWDALASLVKHLGYDGDASHPRGRRLVFLGDLVDRGPDSVRVIEWVMRLVQAGCADCLMGNHELNILKKKAVRDNAWFFGFEKTSTPAQINADQREAMVAFMTGRPLAMHREDLRVVHACWHEPSLALLRQEHDAIAAFHAHRLRIEESLERNGIADKVTRDLALQNDNPVRRLTSGPECRVAAPFQAHGRRFDSQRHKWWETYQDLVFCVFGHYWRGAPAEFQCGPDLFEDYRPHETLRPSSAICIDYSVGARGLVEGVTRLAALRWPDRELVFDDGSVCAIV